MDDGRFDSLVKALAEGKSRRSVLKGLLGLGGAAIVGTAVVESDTDAAVRKTPTPTPVKCPGQQTNVGGVCTCKVPPAPGPNKCGPACCTGKHGDPIPGPPTHTECCDNACCNGTCYGEEQCCPTNTRAGGLPPTHIVCDGPNGKICVEGTCCTDFDCGKGDPCQVCNLETHTCAPRCPGANQVCCTEQAGPGVCVTGECCPGAPCGEDQTCCQGEDETVCCPAGFNCEDGECTPPCVASSVQIFVQTHSGGAGDICLGPFENVVTEVGLYPYANGECSDTAIATATTSANGPAVFPNVPGGQYCALPTDISVLDCLDCPNYGQGVGVNLTVPCSGTFQWTIGVSECCLEGIDVNIFAGANNGDCGQSNVIAGVELGLYDCDTDELLYGPSTTGADGRASFTGVAQGHYCAHATSGSSYSGCETCPDGGPEFDVKCPSFDGWTVLFEDCGACQVCDSGTCRPAQDGTECTGIPDDDDADTGICCNGSCLDVEVCPVLCENTEDCDECEICQMGVCEPCESVGDVCCDDNVCRAQCTPSCSPNCDCSDPANDGYDCNGGLAAGGGVCGCGYCVVPLGDCLCGCAGDTECVQCVGGMCEPANQGEECNGGAGTCQGEWCIAGPTCAEQCLYRCGTLDTGCECGTCPSGQFCMDSGWCCPGTGLGTDANCAYCGDVCLAGTTCQPNAVGGYSCVAGTTCQPEDAACADDGDCCAGLICSINVCSAP